VKVHLIGNLFVITDSEGNEMSELLDTMDEALEVVRELNN
jgi:hypothetical protein